MKITTTYFICSTVRTGSSLLCETMKNTGTAGKPEEYFWHGMEDETWYQDYHPDDYTAYIHRVMSETTTPNGVFGAKMMGGYLWDFIRRIQETPAFADATVNQCMMAVFPNLKHIYLTRRNKVRQAVSWWMAIQTNRWSSGDDRDPDPEPPTYKFEAIDHLLQEIVFREAAWEAYFTRMGVRPLTLVYEDFHDDITATTLKVMEDIGITIPEGLTTPETSLKKQANEVTETWVQRYREEKQSGEGWWRVFW